MDKETMAIISASNHVSTSISMLEAAVTMIETMNMQRHFHLLMNLGQLKTFGTGLHSDLNEMLLEDTTEDMPAFIRNVHDYANDITRLSFMIKGERMGRNMFLEYLLKIASNTSTFARDELDREFDLLGDYR